jgi:hypothetical protein
MKLPFGTLLFLGALTTVAAGQERVQVVSPRTPEGPAAYGIAKLVEAISDRGLETASVKTIEQAASSHVIVTRNWNGFIFAIGI